MDIWWVWESGRVKVKFGFLIKFAKSAKVSKHSFTLIFINLQISNYLAQHDQPHILMNYLLSIFCVVKVEAAIRLVQG
jgi:hypothetical protein